MSHEADLVLEEAYRILTEEKGWTRGTIARDKHGRFTAGVSDSSSSVCLYGAIDLAGQRLGHRNGRPSWDISARSARLRVAEVVGGDIALYNDRVAESVEDVLLVLKRARYDFGDDRC